MNKLFGFYKFNAFQEKVIRKARLLNRFLSSVVFCLSVALLYTMIYGGLYEDLIRGLMGGESISAGLLYALGIISMLLLSIKFTWFVAGHVDRVLNKINADDHINELDYEEMPNLKTIAKEGVIEAGFFSAKTYWKIFDEIKYRKSWSETNNQKINKKKETKKKYSQFFND